MTQPASTHLGESLGSDSSPSASSEGTETIRTLIVGRAITGLGAFT